MRESNSTGDQRDITYQTKVFAMLLRGHTALAGRPRSTSEAETLTAIFRRLLGGFLEANRRAGAAEQARSRRDTDTFQRLLGRHAEAFEAYRRNQESVAEGFNILGVLQLTYNEVRHSMVLAWLLDQDLRRMGSHAQGALGFRLFLAAFKLPTGYADEAYWVRREVAGNNSIVDVEIAARGRFLIHIENKIWSGEGTDQTRREWNDLRRRARELGLNPDDLGAPIHALFLTPRGASPADPHFTPISWARVANVLDAFAGQAKAPDVQLFARHYARAIRRFVASENTHEQPSEVDDEQRTIQ